MGIGTEMNNEDIFMLGHRGFKGPMGNTLPAFRRALRYADGVEFDVRVTGDGKLIAHHDGTFTSGGRVFRIGEVSLSRLRKLHPIGPIVPEIFEVLSLDAPLFNADIKELRAVEPLLALAERMKALDKTVFSTDDVHIAEALLGECPGCRVGFSITGFSSISRLLRLRGLYSVHVPIDVVSYIGYRPFITFLRAFRRRKLRVYLWNYRMDELFWVPRLARLVDVVISDDPARLGKVF